jgi:hypothetical protein
MTLTLMPRRSASLKQVPSSVAPQRFAARRSASRRFAPPRVSAPEVSAPEVSAPEVSATEHGVFEIGAFEIGAVEIGAFEEDSPEVRASEFRAREVRAREVGAPEVRAPEVRARCTHDGIARSRCHEPVSDFFVHAVDSCVAGSCGRVHPGRVRRLLAAGRPTRVPTTSTSGRGGPCKRNPLWRKASALMPIRDSVDAAVPVASGRGLDAASS